MADSIYLNGVQLNTGSINANIGSITISKTFNNATYTLYKQVKPHIFPVSAEAEGYSFELTLWGRGENVYEELLDKEKEIYDIINSQIENHDIVTLTTDSTPVYFNNTDISLLFNSADYTHRATDGKCMINLRFDCIFHGLVLGTLIGNQSNGVGSLAIASYSVGSG